MTSAAETSVKSRPILFNGPMVRAVLSGSKVMTRRSVVVKNSDTSIGRKMLTDLSRAYVDHGFPCNEDGSSMPMERWGKRGPDSAPASAYRYQYLKVPYTHPEDGWGADCGGDRVGRVYCPLGAPGDFLWVRETWWSDRREPGVVVYDATPEWGKYRSNGEVVRAKYVDETLVAPEDALRQMLPKFWSKRPSIHMERWANRITLEITSVRVERLESITPEDALAEGVREYAESHDMGGDWVKAFARLWNEIYKGTEHAWAANPWAWVVAFRRVETHTT